MEEYNVKGLIVREIAVGERDKLLTVLTPDNGKLTVSAKRAMSIHHPHLAATQLFAYCDYQFFRRREYCYIQEATPIELFLPIRYDVEKLALAAYFCDVIATVTVEDVGEPEQFRLILNALHALSTDMHPAAVIRGAFEFRAAAQSGFMPDLTCCSRCGAYENVPTMYLDIMNGSLICEKCQRELDLTPDALGFDGHEEYLRPIVRLNAEVLNALRLITYAEQKKIMSFSLNGDDLHTFSDVCEKYLHHHLERGFSTLDYYKSLATEEI